MKIFIIGVFAFSFLHSATLKNTYFIHSSNIKLRDIVSDAKYDVTIGRIAPDKKEEKIKTKRLLQILKSHGYSDFSAKTRYVKFVKTSILDLSKLESFIKQYYKNNIKNIDIKYVKIQSKRHVGQLPKLFDMYIANKSYFSNKGTLQIKSKEFKTMFFEYEIDASIKALVLKKDVAKSEQISADNVQEKIFKFRDLKSFLLQKENISSYQFKTYLTVGHIVTLKDVESIDLVKKDSIVSVSYKNGSISIAFSAKSLQNGKLNDIITVQKKNKQKIKVTVVGKNKVEMR